MLALIFTWKARPMIIGSSSGWLRLAGMIARPRATSLRTSSAGTPSRSATNSISSVISPRRANWSWVIAPDPRRTSRRRPGGTSAGSPPVRRPVSATARAAIHGRRSGRQPVADVVPLRAGRVVHPERAARRRQGRSRASARARRGGRPGGSWSSWGTRPRSRWRAAASGEGVRFGRGRAVRVAIAVAPSVGRRSAALARVGSRAPHSLRRYQPDQVPRVRSQSGVGSRCPWRRVKASGVVKGGPTATGGIPWGWKQPALPIGSAGADRRRRGATGQGTYCALFPGRAPPTRSIRG